MKIASFLSLLNKQIFYIFASFLVGFSVMTVELISGRILAPIIGSSVFTWTSVIGITLLGIAIGSFIGGQIADKSMSNKTLSYAFILSAISIALIPTLSKHTDFITNPLDSILKLNLILSVYLFFLPACFLGTILPILLKSYTLNFLDIGKKYGLLSFFWSTGSVLGVFLTGFFFISNTGSRETLIIISILLTLTGLIFVNGRKVLIFVSFILLIFLISSLFLEKKQNVGAIIFEKETNYYNIKIADADIPGIGKARLLFLDLDLQNIESLSYNQYTNTYKIYKYINKDIKNILAIGGGAYRMPKNFKDHYKDINMTVVESDPEITNVANKYFDLLNYNIKTVTSDARFYLNKNNEKYDLIFSDAYNSFISVPWYLLTKEWNDIARSKLNKNGIYAIYFVGSLEGEDSRITKSIINTFKITFPNFYILSLNEDKKEIQNIALIGINGFLPIEEKDLIKKISLSGDKLLAKNILLKENLNTGDESPILTDNFSPTEKLMDSIIKKHLPDSLFLMRRVLN